MCSRNRISPKPLAEPNLPADQGAACGIAGGRPAQILHHTKFIMKRDFMAVILFVGMVIAGVIAVQRQHEIDHLRDTVDAISAKYRTVLARQVAVKSAPPETVPAVPADADPLWFSTPAHAESAMEQPVAGPPVENTPDVDPTTDSTPD